MSKTHFVVFSAFLAACSGKPPELPEPEGNSAQLETFESGVKAFDAEDDETAKVLFESVLSEHPSPTLAQQAQFYLARLEGKKKPARGATQLYGLADKSDDPDFVRQASTYGAIVAASGGFCRQVKKRLKPHLDALNPELRGEAELAMARCMPGEEALPHLSRAAESPDEATAAAAVALARERVAALKGPALTKVVKAHGRGPIAAPVRERQLSEALIKGDVAEIREAKAALAEDEPEARPTPPDPPRSESKPAVKVAPLRVAVILPLSGRSRRLGEDLQALVKRQLAASEDAPTAPNLKLELRDGGSEAQAVSAIRELAAQEVFAAVGLFDQSAASGAARAAAEVGLPLLMLTLSDVAITVEGPVWRTLHTPTLVARTAAGAALGRRTKRAVVVHGADAYGTSLGQAFKAAYKAGGGELADDITWTSAPDFPVLAKRIADSRATAVFIPVEPLIAAQLLGRLAERRIFAMGEHPRFAKERSVREVVILGPPEWYDPNFLKQASRYADQVLIPVPYGAETARGAALSRQMGDLKRRPTAFDALLLDAIKAIEKGYAVHASTGKSAPEALRSVTLTDGFTAGLKLSERDAVTGLLLMTVRDGRFTPSR